MNMMFRFLENIKSIVATKKDIHNMKSKMENIESKIEITKSKIDNIKKDIKADIVMMKDIEEMNQKSKIWNAT